MSQEGDKKKPDIPSIKIEEPDPSQLSYAEKISRFGQRLLNTSSASLVSPTSPTPPKSPKKMEGLQSQFDLKEETVDVELKVLENSLVADPPDAAKISENLHFVQLQVREAQTLHKKLMELLLKEKDKKEECTKKEANMSQLLRKVFRVENEALDKLALLKKPKVKTEDENGAANDEALLIRNEQRITDKEAENLDLKCKALDEELAKDVVNSEELICLLEEVKAAHASYTQCQSSLIERMRAAKKSEEVSNEMFNRKHFQVGVARFERKVRERTGPPQSNERDHPIVYEGQHDRYHKDLPKLTSHPKEWLPFWAIFKETHENNHLSKLQKFRRLLQATTEGSPARDTVTLYSMSASNYSEALAHLKRDYGRESILIKIYVRELMQIAIDRSSGKHQEFRKMVNEITANLKNLESLNVTSDQCSQFLYPMLEACLPKDTLKLWQEKESENLNDLIKFLQKQVEKENERKLAHFSFTEEKSKDGKGAKHGDRRGKGDKGKKASPRAGFHNSEESAKCLFCDGRHLSQECRKAQQMSLETKKELIQSKKACYICLEKGHMAKFCKNRAKIICGTCDKGHYAVICPALHSKQTEKREDNFANQAMSSPVPSAPPQNMMDGTPQSPQQAKSSSVTNYSNLTDDSEVPLQLLLVRVEGLNGKTKIVRALLDTGSQKSYVTTALQTEMGFKDIGEETVVHHLFGGGTTPAQKHQIVKLHIAGPNGEEPAAFNVSCVDEIAKTLATTPKGTWIEEFLSRGVTFPRFPEGPGQLEVLIGNDVAPKLYQNQTVDLGSGPVAIKTRWGWVLGGKIPVAKGKNQMSSINITTTLNNMAISQLWDLDLIGIKDEPSTQSAAELARQTEEHFLHNVTRDETGRYQVKLPFLTGAVETLPSNYSVAERRLLSTTESLKKTNYLDKYDLLFRQWEDEGIIEEITFKNNADWKEQGHYLPHRAVIKLSSETTPVRPVFDASSRSKGQPSLNICLDAGPNYLELIASIMTRFRLGKIGITADIRKAFQMINVDKDHRKYLRFLWWKNPLQRNKVKVYQHCRVPFGVNSSPYLLAATLKHHLSQSPVSHGETAKRLQKSLYVDNCFESRSSIEEALHFQKQSVELFAPAKFELRDWYMGPNGERKEIPALGMIWDMGQDTLRIDVEAALEKATNPATQRNVLAVAHSLFDPLGFIAPFILPVKLILRQCHEKKLGWDKPLPEDIVKTYDQWKAQIPIIDGFRIPRHAYKDQSQRSTLHAFSDASGEAYAAAVFLRCETSEGVKVTLLQSKARIATKAMKVTIPRMELIGNVVAVRLAESVRDDIGEPHMPTTYYTDSATALAWIQNDGPWGVFVSNRVNEIRKKTTTEQWRHVPGKFNPADLPLRGCSSKKLLESEWWRGPSWLYESEEKWPASQKVVPVTEEANKEKRKEVAINVTIPSSPHPLEKFLRYSDYPKILRCVSYWRRYIGIVRERIQNPHRAHFWKGQEADPKLISPPTLTETEEAEKCILQYIQKDLDKTHLKKLRPFTSEGILRTSTPIFSDHDKEFASPIILPEKNEFVNRMLWGLHKRGCHMGTQLLHAKAREKFWIVNGRKVCRGVIAKCLFCKRFNARRLQVPEGQLPIDRTNTGVAWNAVGVDMAGPFILKKGVKVWVALFTCTTYRAIHMEVVDNMSTDEFLEAFRAFANRRGKPKVVYSDNGLNFVGANAAFKKVYQKEAQQFATEHGIKWRFNPPNAPWVGGFYERMIGLVKSLTTKVLGKKIVTKKELVGLLMEVEEILNNRPLTYVSESPDDPAPLTPNMMVRNSGSSYFPELEIRDASHARAAYKRIQRLRETLRTSFRARYLGALCHQRAGGHFRPLQSGDVVLLEQDNEKRVNWPMGVIMEAIPGKDNFPRTYLVKTKFGVVLRAAQKLFPMELQDPEPDQGEKQIDSSPSQDEN